MRKNIIKKITVFTAPMLILTLMLGALFTLKNVWLVKLLFVKNKI